VSVGNVPLFDQKKAHPPSMATQSTTHTTQQLLDILRPNQQPEAWFEQTRQLNWDDFAVRAIAFGLAPQLHAVLKTWDIPLPAKAMAKLAITYKAQAKRSEAIYAQLAQVLTACAAENLHPVCLKGIHLAATYYAKPALRPMNDIDLLFTLEELPQAEAVLLSLGYGGKHKSAETGARVTKHTSTFRRENKGANGRFDMRPSVAAQRKRSTPNPYLSASLDRTVEPHSSLEESWFGLKVDITPGIRERTETAVLAQYPCRVLNPQDLLHHICLHFCFHLIQGAPSFVQLTDTLMITQANKVDWPIFMQRVQAAKTSGYVLAALSLAEKLISAPIPEAILAQLASQTPSRLRQRIDTLDLTYVLRRTQQKPLNTLGDRLRRGVQDRVEIARWASTFGGKLRVWQTAVQFTRTDTAQLLKK